eukprot:10301063-Karenia_brevis.AAC.2
MTLMLMAPGWRTGQKLGNGPMILAQAFLPTCCVLPLVVRCLVETSVLLSTVVYNVFQNKAVGLLTGVL